MATHLRAGEIIVERVNCQSLTFRITIIVFTDTGSEVKFGDGFLDFGDGTDPIQLPQIDNSDRSDLGPQVATASFTIDHTYSSPGKYVIGYVEPNRNEGVLNIDNSVNTTFYVETEINIDPFLGCNNSPVLLIPPIDRACPGVAFFHNPGAYDPDGDSIAFELVVPKKEVGTVVDGYVDPNAQGFYENYGQGNENMNGTPTFSIDPISGELKWDAPGAVGEYNVAFIVKEYRKINGDWFKLGFVTRDMQIIVEDCDNERPELQIPEDICVEAGETIDEVIFGTDPNNDNVKIEAFSQVFDLGATVDPDDGSFQPSTPPAELRFTWETECLDIRDQPYQVVFKITDNPAEGPKLVSFATWNITVVGPKPDFTSVQQDGQGILLNWDPYICSNANQIQVWRRVDSNPYTPDDCETGIRENAGYKLINEIDASATSYKDLDLAAAAKYCYRLVATFAQPAGGESIVSDELCFEFVPAEDPIITNVSVEKTGESNGEILVAWREPYEIDDTIYPRPYIYKVYRAEGFTGDANIVEVHSVQVDDATTDRLEFRDTGLNTAGKVYNYRIELEAPNAVVGDEDPIFSAVASSVRLEPVPQFQRIELRWSAEVPWSNVIPFPPDSKHLIYRGEEGATDAELQLIDEVDVNLNGFVYVDSGQFNNTPLRDDRVYCYKIMTKGTYGNPAISSPLLNFSQMVCAQPSDSIPPCAPQLSITGLNCEQFVKNLGCDLSDAVYENVLRWSTDFLDDCQDDVNVYELYYAGTKGSEYQLLATVRDTFYVHNEFSTIPLNNSFKGCYKVKAIDRSGNESEFSEEFCVDNCPYIELPNIITPDNQDGFNDVFRPFGPESFNNPEVEELQLRCVRFVESIDFKVFNRWGTQVYSYKGRVGTEKTIYINWDGKSDDGKELSSGVYFYEANVTYDTVDPENASERLKGWIHVVR